MCHLSKISTNAFSAKQKHDRSCFEFSVARMCGLPPIWQISDPLCGRNILCLFNDWWVLGCLGVRGKLAGFLENRPKSGGFDKKNLTTLTLLALMQSTWTNTNNKKFFPSFSIFLHGFYLFLCGFLLIWILKRCVLM